MELSPSWEAANCAATQELHSVLWNPKVHYRVHKSPPLIPNLRQIDPIHTNPSYISKIHFNIVHPPLRVGVPSGLFPSEFPTIILYAFPQHFMELENLLSCSLVPTTGLYP
jgi:hypothetical protein